jgi:YegS/Rv2252/BmrU family lipid kinase
MQAPEKLNFLFVINPGSGGKTNQNWETIIRDFFKPLEHGFEFYVIDEKHTSTQLQDHIRKSHPDRVVAVGGDGTITMVGKLLLGSNTALGILPGGSANGMARELQIPLDPTQALEIAVNGIVKCADVLKINDEICLHLSDIGMNAQLIKYFEEGKARGKLGYAKVALKVLRNRQHIQVIIETKDVEIRRNAFMVVLANASKYGFGAVINPEGNLYDGFFEVIIIRRLAISELFKMWFRPQPFNPKKIELYHARSVSIETDRKVHFQVDGEYLGKVNKIKARIIPTQLNILLPPENGER